jgi:hypothetical protein
MVEIQDMYLAALLLSYNFEYDGVDKSDPKRQKFLFSDGTKPVWEQETSQDVGLVMMSVADVENAYIDQRILFPPNFPDALKRIKYVIHSKDEDVRDNKRIGRSGSVLLSDHPKTNPIG